ncbi:MAG: hypothetical protein H0V66_10830 [Bdellovibrionales bacterium]|nr:hypothetical protein [Bdellovibrionales bacterium]
MSKVIKANVISGRYKGEVVRVTNISVDEAGRQNAACFLASGQRANIPVVDLSVIEEKAPEPETPRAKTSMPFVSGSTGSRTMTQTKNMQKPKIRNKTFVKNENDEEE